MLLQHRDELPSTPATPEMQDRERNADGVQPRAFREGGAIYHQYRSCYYSYALSFIPGAPWGVAVLQLCPRNWPNHISVRTVPSSVLLGHQNPNGPGARALPSLGACRRHPDHIPEETDDRVGPGSARVGKDAPGTSQGCHCESDRHAVTCGRKELTGDGYPVPAP